MPNQTETLGQYIVRKRKSVGMTQEDLAARLKQLNEYRAASTIANWETDKQAVPLELLAVLAQALNEPSPTKLYALAGILDKIPGGGIALMLYDEPQETVQLIERLARVVIQERHE